MQLRDKPRRRWRRLQNVVTFSVLVLLVVGPTNKDVALSTHLTPERQELLKSAPRQATKEIKPEKADPAQATRPLTQRNLQVKSAASPQTYEITNSSFTKVTEELRNEIQAVLDLAVEELSLIDPAAVPSISIEIGGSAAHFNENIPTLSASSAKAYWVAAAVNAVGVARVEQFAEAIFMDSDNNAAGQVIDLVGIDAINSYTAAIGMANTFLSSWSYGRTRVASSTGQDGNPTFNQTTTADALIFLRKLLSEELFDAYETSTLLSWMLLSPDNLKDPTYGLGGVLTDALEPSVSMKSMHKAGWLPPGCCRRIENALIAIGIIPIESNDPLLIAISTHGGSNYGADTTWISTLVSKVFTVSSSFHLSSNQDTPAQIWRVQ